MSAPTISVVMPVYNSLSYVEKSVRAVLAQSFSNFELLICDDCSTDGSWPLLQKLASEDARIRVLRTEANSGSAKIPREMAIRAAVSPWVCWIDSDDVVPPNYLQKLMDRAIETDADCVCSRMEAFEENGCVRYTLPPNESFDYSVVVTGKEACMMTIGLRWGLNANGFLVRRDLWVNSSTFLSPEVIQMNADDLTTREILLSCGKVAFADVRYGYRLHADGITKKVSKKLFEPLLTDCMVIDLLKTRFGGGSEESRGGYCQLMFHYISCLRLYVVKNHEFSDDDKSAARLHIKRAWKKLNIRSICHASEISMSQRSLLLLPPIISIFLVKILHSFK